MKVGERVRASGRAAVGLEDVGIGTLTKIYPDGKCNAEFECGQKFTGVPQTVFTSIEKLEQEAQKLKQREDELHQKLLAQRYMPLKEHPRRFNTEDWRPLVRKLYLTVGKTHVLTSLLSENFSSLQEFMAYNPDQFHKLRDCGKTTARLLKKIRKSVLTKYKSYFMLLDELRHRFTSDFLTAESYFRESCTEFITAQEYEVEKRLFVKKWLETNTSSRKGSRQLPDDEQISAIASVHGHTQVVARAGSGKTTTLVNRTFFLIKHCRIAPSEILLLIDALVKSRK